MKFSERQGHSKPDLSIQTDGMNLALRNSLWNVLDASIFSSGSFRYDTSGNRGEILGFARNLWFSHFKQPMDEIPLYPTTIMETIRDHFFGVPWFGVYDFVEFVVSLGKYPGLEKGINKILEIELAGYRLIEGHFVPVTDRIEVEEIQRAASGSRFSGVEAHLKQAISHLSRHDSPDYRNSIKESISAVECMAREVSGNPKATLGDALQLLERGEKLHPALKKGFSSIYGYSNDEGGIRHAMLDEPNLTASDAKFFLVVCSSFINYLKTKI